MLKLHDISKTYNDSTEPVFAHITLNVALGEFVSIIGPSGCGKSTLLEICVGLQSFDNGRITLNDQIIDHPGLCSFMPQGDSLLPWRKLNSNIALPIEAAGASRRSAIKQANHLLDQFDMGTLANRWPLQLSGGQKQRGALLRSIAHDRDLLVLDEPLGALDSLTRKNIQVWLKHLIQTSQKSALMVTHDVDEAVFLSDRIYIMRPGKTLAEIVIDLDNRDRNSKEFRDICIRIDEVLNDENN
ncbi:MAG: ABC transporter ATP-binding protein [Alphaproteobacteria bacterium]